MATSLRCCCASVEFERTCKTVRINEEIVNKAEEGNEEYMDACGVSVSHSPSDDNSRKQLTFEIVDFALSG
ncbi:hypothetical protein L596_004185 [Steinernema carpocapsae]|uniref:Uncharacterized protein n=1 Tax=Steinernema carpocapsae TaxID=34508 RepID=A0A4U8UZ44_STECR|nr:hypothetical protein L596_004185 [Steinernema carpocapsae]